MHSHFGYLVLFAAAVGVVLGAMLRKDPRAAAQLAAYITAGLVGSALAVAWAMYLIAP